MLEAYVALSGRIRRWRFFLYSVVLWIILPVLGLIAIPLVGNARYPFAAALIVTRPPRRIRAYQWSALNIV